jgi:hypothetical protein
MEQHPEQRRCKNCGARLIRACYCGTCKMILCRTCMDSPAHAAYDAWAVPNTGRPTLAVEQGKQDGDHS